MALVEKKPKVSVIADQRSETLIRDKKIRIMSTLEAIKSLTHESITQARKLLKFCQTFKNRPF